MHVCLTVVTVRVASSKRDSRDTLTVAAVTNTPSVTMFPFDGTLGLPLLSVPIHQVLLRNKSTRTRMQ